jgi:hypothetical protein
VAKDTVVKISAFVGLVVAAALMSFLAPVRATAQNGSSDLGSASSSGLIAKVMAVAYTQDRVSIEIVIKNTNTMRVYLEDAQDDNSQKAFLGSGENLNPPMPEGISFCDDDYATCILKPSYIDIQKFSYIEPNGVLGLMMQYQANQKPSNPDTISFSVVLMARFARSDADDSPDDAGSIREVTFSFPFLSFSPEN